jgi:uncharacterized membrane protein YkoI
MTIIILIGLLLACVGGSVLLSQQLVNGFRAERSAEADDDRAKNEGDDDDGDNTDEEDDDNDDDDNTDERDDDDDDANLNETDQEGQITGSIRVDPGTDNLTRLAEISAAEAEQIALEAQPDAQIEEIELEVENGFLVYEVELGNNLLIIVDAGNGDILATEVGD